MKKIDLRSEKGAALVLEATIVYPIVLVVVFFMLIWGLTFVQKAYLNHCSYQIADYISKCILYPGYEKLVDPFYEKPSDTGELIRVNDAMKVHIPYRYLFGMSSEVGSIINDSKTAVTSYLPSHGYMKATSGTVKAPSGYSAEQISTVDGYTCAIKASSSSVTVYIGQRYVFSDMFRMIGLGGRNYDITVQNSAFINDSVEIIRVTDMVYDTVIRLAEHFNIDMNKMMDTLAKFTQS